jgi:hypothetical protein
MVLASLMPTVATAQQGAERLPETNIQDAISLMMSFAERTGLNSARPPRRYLWTDAFAVCNFLALADATSDQQYTELALRLVDQVHHTLGRHRDDDPRSGWISGLSEDEGEEHPTAGGLRIGKSLPERGPGERFNDRLEWDRDGQYFHYLTKWTHALDQISRSGGDPKFNRYARELAKTSYNAFTYLPFASRGPRRMYWKMSIDLSRPLVPTMGQHDPLDGYITLVQLQSTMKQLPEVAGGVPLETEIAQFVTMVESGDWATSDPLGLGGLLTDAYRVQQLRQQGAPIKEDLLGSLLSAALEGLRQYAGESELQMPPDYRLAFRELGLAIGLQAVEQMWQTTESRIGRSNRGTDIRALLMPILKYVPIRTTIVAFWHDPKHRYARSWSEHRDINEVMLATSLLPDGFLLLASPQR